MDWDGVECIQRNTEITGYIVCFSGTSITDEVTVRGRGSDTFIITELIPFTSYSIKVAADSGLGRGPFSDPITLVTDSESFSMNNQFWLALGFTPNSYCTNIPNLSHLKQQLKLM